jgi:SAM-dependent methyltransferase
MKLGQVLTRLRSSGPAAEPASPPPLLDVEGFCPVCDQATRFQSWSTWLRDGLICLNCHSAPRARAFYTVLERVRPNWRELTIHESSPSAGESKLARDCPGYLVSQFDPALPLGGRGPDWRNEDLSQQTFPDESFDIVVTQDVFEHLLEPDRAIAEIARTLKPDGIHIATVPLVAQWRPSRRRAGRAEDGAIEHHHAAEYHQNPIDEEGSLVTIDWGYDIADFFDQHGGLNTTIFALDDLSRGIRAELIEVLVSRKSGRLEL